jgi:hypothetical protein
VITVPVMAVIIIVPVIMISVIVIPVEWAPWMPVRRIISPVPRRVPGNIMRKIYESDKRPGSNFIRGGTDHSNILTVITPSDISGISCLT